MGARQKHKYLNEKINVINSGIINPDDKCKLLANDVDNIDANLLDEIKVKCAATHTLSPRIKEVIYNSIAYYRLYLNHYNEYTANKRIYYWMIDNVKPGQCVITLDYKEKPKVGHKPQEEGWVFHNFRLRNCLGIAFEFEDERVVIDSLTNVTN
eukprot:279772_1